MGVSRHLGKGGEGQKGGVEVVSLLFPVEDVIGRDYGAVEAVVLEGNLETSTPGE